MKNCDPKDTNLQYAEYESWVVPSELTEHPEEDEMDCDQLEGRIKTCNEVITVVKLVAYLHLCRGLNAGILWQVLHM